MNGHVRSNNGGGVFLSYFEPDSISADKALQNCQESYLLEQWAVDRDRDASTFEAELLPPA